MSDLSNPNTITETYLATLSGDYSGELPVPVTRQHEYLAKICKKQNGLKEDLDTLNQGGLNLKEDFIGQQVNEWLDEHPEATTTVQDGSIFENKIADNAVTLKKN